MVLRDISDTAFWAAAYRASESERADALFHDVFACSLAGPRGQRIVEEIEDTSDNRWVIAIRTYLIDQAIARAVAQGADMVINLAAGLDARPYRMTLPRSLQWIEVDLPEILTYKETILHAALPVCTIERVGLDLSNSTERRALFQDLSRRAQRAIVVTEGLLIYLTKEEVSELSRGLAVPDSFRLWIFDLQLPPLVRLLQQRIGPVLGEAKSPFSFKSNDWNAVFATHGWVTVETVSMLEAAARARRVPVHWGARSNPLATGTEGRDKALVTRPELGARRIDGVVCSVAKR